MLSLEQAALIGFLLGPVLRTIYDVFWAIRDNPDLVFDRRYLLTMGASMGIAFIVGLVYSPIILDPLPEGSIYYVFLSSLAQGFMLNHIINRPLDSSRHRSG